MVHGIEKPDNLLKTKLLSPLMISKSNHECNSKVFKNLTYLARTCISQMYGWVSSINFP